MQALTFAMPRPSFVLIAALFLAFAASQAATAKQYNVSSTFVHNACKGRLQSANGQTGCTRCDADLCRDYNCSDGSNGVAKGCKETIIGRTTSGSPKNGKGFVPSRQRQNEAIDGLSDFRTE